MRLSSAIVLFAGLPVSQIFAPRISPLFFAISVLLCCVSCVVFRDGLKGRTTSAKVDKYWIWARRCLFALLTWSVVTLLWGLDLQRGAHAVGVWFAAFAGAWFLGNEFSQIPRPQFSRLLLVSVIIATISLSVALIISFAGYSVVSSIEIYDYNRNAIFLCFIIWPAIYCVAGKSRMLLIFIPTLLFAVVAIFQSHSETAKLGLLIGSAALLIAFTWRNGRSLAALGISGLMLAMPFTSRLLEKFLAFVPEGFATSANGGHRILIWHGFSDLISQKWLFGWGMASNRILGKGSQARHYTEQAGYHGHITSPHNFVLELWINVGFVGVFLLALAILFSGWIKLESRISTAAFTALLAAVFSVLLTGSSGFQGWLVADVAIAGTALYSLIAQEKHQ